MDIFLLRCGYVSSVVKTGGKLMKTLLKLIRDEEGASMAEYALLLGLIVVGVATVVATFRGQITDQFTRAGNAISPQ